MAFLSLNASEFVEMFVGVGASRVRDLFAQVWSSAELSFFSRMLHAEARAPAQDAAAQKMSCDITHWWAASVCPIQVKP